MAGLLLSIKLDLYRQFLMAHRAALPTNSTKLKGC